MKVNLACKITNFIDSISFIFGNMVIELQMLQSLSFKKQLTFAYLACERLYRNYVYFSKEYDFGNPDELRALINYIYENLFNNSIDNGKTNLLISKVDPITPEPGDYNTILASSALDACGATYESLHFLLDKNFNRVKTISTLATDSVDMYIQEVDNIDFNRDNFAQQKIDNHPLMQMEKKIQSGIIHFLNEIPTLNPEDVETLTRLQDNIKKSDPGL